MELRYQHAIISFCPRLTEPDGFSVPVAAVLVGGTTDGAAAVAAAMVMPDAEKVAEDPLTKAVVRDLLRILKGHIDDAGARTMRGDEWSAQLLRTLQHALRNTLFVSFISEETAVPLSSTRDIAKVVNEALREHTLVARRAERRARDAGATRGPAGTLRTRPWS